MNPYIGHDSQLYGIEEHRLVGGKGDGMRLYEINNGQDIHIFLIHHKKNLLFADVIIINCG